MTYSENYDPIDKVTIVEIKVFDSDYKEIKCRKREKESLRKLQKSDKISDKIRALRIMATKIEKHDR